MLAPTLLPPLHAGHQGQENGGQAPGPVIVDEVGPVQSDQTSGKHNQPAEEGDVRMVLVWDPLGHQTPGDAEAQPDEDLNGSVHGELQGVGVLVEGDPEEYSKPTDGDHVIRGAGGDHQGGDTFRYPVASEGN